jgi:hypothetical protein
VPGVLQETEGDLGDADPFEGHDGELDPVEPDPLPERAGALAESAGAYAQLRRWISDPEILTPRIELELAEDDLTTRVRILASMAAAQACLPTCDMIPAHAVHAVLEGDAGMIERHLHTALARVAGRAHPPGRGRSVESLYPVWAPLLLGEQRLVESWDHDVLTVVDMLAPHLSAGTDDHLTNQLGVLALLWWHERAGKPRARDQEGLAALAQMVAHRDAPQRAREAVTAMETAFSEPWQRQRTVVVQTAVDQHLNHGGLAWAALAQWVGSAAQVQVPAHQVEPIQRRGPWWRAWQDADQMCEQAKPHWGAHSWDGTGVRALLALARYTVAAQHPDADNDELLARTVWQLRSHERFYALVPDALRRLGHDVDQCDLADEVSSAWAWVHREWPPTLHGTDRHRYDGLARGVAWGGSQCAAHVLLTPWAENIAAPALARMIGAIPLGARVRVVSGEHAERTGTVVAARVQDSPQTMESLRPPTQYRVHLGPKRPHGEGEVFNADQLAHDTFSS